VAGSCYDHPQYWDLAFRDETRLDPLAVQHRRPPHARKQVGADLGPEPAPERAGEQLDRIWTKYTGEDPPYALRDPAIEEKRVLFECRIDRIATFGKP